MDQKTDAEIVARVLKGDVQAYALLIEAYKGPVYNLAYRMTGVFPDADDLTQETFIRAYQKLYQFDQEKIFFTWLYTLAVNLIRNHLKKNARDIAFFTAQHLSSASQSKDKGENPLSEDSAVQLDAAMQKLPVDIREVLILKFHQEMTFEEVAAITGNSLSAVKMRVYRGLEKIKAILDKQK